jgi:hypothetical protein
MLDKLEETLREGSRSDDLRPRLRIALRTARRRGDAVGQRAIHLLTLSADLLREWTLTRRE